MWKQINLEGVDGIFSYKTEGDSFYISCFSPSVEAGGKKLYIHSELFDGQPLCLGTFSPSESGYSLEKSYPISFFQMNGININEDKNLHFSLQESERKAPSLKDFAEDPALRRAKDLTGNPAATQESKKQATEQRRLMSEKLSAYPIAKLPAFGDYTFHIMDNIIHPFGLTAIDHIVHSSEFVSAFVKSKKWYIGSKKDCETYAICIESGKEGINPMYNASDCDFTLESDGRLYHFVGIGICDDGQYFCRLESE